MRRPLALGAASTAAVALLAGCGSSGKSSSTSATSTTASAPAQSTTAAKAAAAGSAVTVQTKHNKLGTILAAGPKKLTVYLFEADRGATSSCVGACAKVWPPVTSAGPASVAASAVSADLGTTPRADGTQQLTYNGHPLYYFAKDGDAGDAYGQGSTQFGAGWYVLNPGGSKIDSDAKSSGAGSPGSGAGSARSSAASPASVSRY